MYLLQPRQVPQVIHLVVIQHSHILRLWSLVLIAAVTLLLASPSLPAQESSVNPWSGIVLNSAGAPVDGANVQLATATSKIVARTGTDGRFRFPSPAKGSYSLSVDVNGSTAIYGLQIALPQSAASVQLTVLDTGSLSLKLVNTASTTSGGEQLSGKDVSEIPLNKRDFSQLLLLAAGTMTDANGSTNFTQQFAINGQRGVEAVFAMDGADISDPEMGGATFSNFNVDAVQEIQSSSGWMPAEIGRGAAGYTNIITRSGNSGFHGSLFEFIRNSALDARNYFDHSSPEDPRRIPPFQRNEFGFTNGGPVVLPHMYDGRGKTFYFAQYQGFRQVLGTTQVMPVPTTQERAGLDTTAFPGDTLYVPVNALITPSLNRYPLPNAPGGAFGVHTYATSSKVVTNANQYAIRLDQKLSDKAQLFIRFNFNNLTGPTTNPDQTAIDPSFGIQYLDRQRNGIITYTRTVSPQYMWDSALSFTRTTPSFPTANHTDPALTFGDGFYEPFNSAGGSVTTAYGNLFHARQGFVITAGKHAIKIGLEIRSNRDTTYFGMSPNGQYTFGGGTAYSPVEIPSMSGTHNIHRGDPLPDTLTGLLTASPFAYTLAVAPSYFPQGEHIGAAAISRDSGSFFIQDSWKITDRLVLNYGLRWEVYSPIRERANRTSGIAIVAPPNHAQQSYVINPQPPYKLNWDGLGPRVQVSYRAKKDLLINVGGGLTTIPPNIWQDNFLTGSTPFVVYPRLTALPGAPIQYGNQITPSQLPQVYTPAGVNIFPDGNTKNVASNTVMDVNRFERDLAAVTSEHQIAPLNVSSIDPNFGNGYLATWALGLERKFGPLDATATYVGTAGVHLPRVNYPNAYAGADAAYAPFTEFDSAGKVTGGFGTEMVIEGSSHSSYNALQTSLQGNIPHGGPSIQASYTWSKSLDDTSSVIGGFVSGGSGASAQSAPQNPFNVRAEKGPSTFDVANGFTLNLAQELPFGSVDFLRPMGHKVVDGWELLSISSISSGSPFTVYSGVQQTGVGANGVDRPDQIETPHLSTSHAVRQDYFGRGAENASYFSIPINVAGGTGPNQGVFGSLSRNTYRGPAFYNFDFALIKDTPFGRRGKSEMFNAQFRAEFFNLFNIVNFGLPSNTIKGSGFGQISRTAGTSRQIQFSLKIQF
jgi:hypothetical protein